MSVGISIFFPLIKIHIPLPLFQNCLDTFYPVETGTRPPSVAEQRHQPQQELNIASSSQMPATPTFNNTNAQNSTIAPPSPGFGRSSSSSSMMDTQKVQQQLVASAVSSNEMGSNTGATTSHQRLGQQTIIPCCQSSSTPHNKVQQQSLQASQAPQQPSVSYALLSSSSSSSFTSPAYRGGVQNTSANSATSSVSPHSLFRFC